MPNQPISGNDLARFAGPQTFMRLPEAQGPEGLDVVIMGIPHGYRHLLAVRHAVWSKANSPRKRDDPAV